MNKTKGKNGWMGKRGGIKGSRGGVRGRWRMCVQVWDMTRWITPPNRQFITVRERERERETGDRGKERGEQREAARVGYPVEKVGG